MSLLGVWTLAIGLATLVPGLRAACVDCNDQLAYPCNANSTGVYCDESATIYRVSDAVYAIKPHLLYPGCEPPRVIIESVNHYCCVYSPERGCQVAVNLHAYNFEPNRYKFCDLCKHKCRCALFSEDKANSMQTLHWSCLGAIVLLVFWRLTQPNGLQLI